VSPSQETARLRSARAARRSSVLKPGAVFGLLMRRAEAYL